MPRKHRLLTALLLSAPAVGFAKAPPPPDSAAPKALLDLRAKLLSTPKDDAKHDVGKFRALCDDEGYPLVGNIANKSERLQPSEVCATLRKPTK